MDSRAAERAGTQAPTRAHCRGWQTGVAITAGISTSRLEAVVSFGETQPLIVTQGRERRNRRTVTEVSGFVSGHPNVLDGKYAQIIYRDYVRSAEAPTGLSGIEGSEFITSE